MAYSAPQRPVAVYSAVVGLVVLSVCGFVAGLRLYMPHPKTAVAEAIQITTPAPTIPPAAPVAVAQAEPAPAPHRSHAKHDDTDAANEASAPTGDQADADALAPVDRPAADTADAADGSVAEQAAPARAEDAQPQKNAGPAAEPDR